MDTFVIPAQLKLKTDRFPQEQKKENIVPVCGKGNVQCITNYALVYSLSGMGIKL